MQVTLKIAYNLRDLTMKQDVRKFFFSRFKRQLIKKNLIEKIQKKVTKSITETEFEIRAKQSKVYLFFFNMQSSKWFSFIAVLAIFGNALILMLSKYPIDSERENTLEVFNLFFFTFFCFELIIKLIGRGFKFYFIAPFNWFDTAIVLVSALDIT